MTKIFFEEINLYGHKNVKCAGGCGRRLTRSKKFYQTLNPFNKLPTGEIKSGQDIYYELAISRSAWEKDPETCIHCQKKIKEI